ncbi:hypothetical protein, partial [Burkholderia pseudomallei]|uniref:hypothetical protein n=1 Tax=Burkholderia pseudomallei TaxID=28450 RepID=UPI001F236897
LFVISSVPLPALSLAQATAKPLIRLSEFARPPLSPEKRNDSTYSNSTEAELECFAFHITISHFL